MPLDAEDLMEQLENRKQITDMVIVVRVEIKFTPMVIKLKLTEIKTNN